MRRVCHRADHVAPDVHARSHQILPAALRRDGMHLREGGGDAHRHVHHRAERADDHARHEQAAQADGRPRLAQLQQRLHVRQAQPSTCSSACARKAEDHRQRHAREAVPTMAQTVLCRKPPRIVSVTTVIYAHTSSVVSSGRRALH